MSENNRKPTLAEEFGFEDERMTIAEIMAMEAEEEDGLEDLPLSKYAKMWANYMEEEHPARKSFLILEGIWQETLQEVSTEARETAINVLAPLITIIVVVYYFARKSSSDEMDYKKWDTRIKIAIICGVGIETASLLINLFVSYYQ